MSPLTQTPSQTVGPFFSIGLIRPSEHGHILFAGSDQARIIIEGGLYDGAGAPVTDGVIEVWQADASGDYRGGAFGRTGTDENGRFAFDSVKPGPVRGAQGMQAPHVNVAVFARGMLLHAFSRIYFEGDRLDDDPVLSAVPAERRTTLIATRSTHDAARYHWDVHLQGDGETVFFDA